MCYTLHGSVSENDARNGGFFLMSYAVVRMQKMKSHDLKGMQFHNQRERGSKTNPDIDKNKTHENYDLVNSENVNYNERVKEIIESQKTGTRKTRKDAVLVNELLVTSDREFFERLDPVEQKRFFEESFKLFSERYGKQNVAYATVHMDEKTPHMHLGVVPMRDGKLQGKNVFNRQELLWLQDEFPKHMQKLGFELERGEKGSGREHIETQEFKRQTLEKDIDLLEKNLKIKKNELMEMSKNIPPELKIKAKKEKKTIVEDKIITFGKPKTIEKETGNLVITHDEYKKMCEVVNAANKIKSDYDRLQQTDLVKENKQLREIASETLKENKDLKERNETVRKEYTKLYWENDSLKDQISDLKHEIGSIYKSTKEFLKAHTSDFKTFKSLFKDLVSKVKEKSPKGEFERLNRIEKRHEMDRGMER